MEALLALDDQAKVWIYASNRVFTDEERDSLEKDLADFTEQWASHNRKLKAYGNIFHHKFICLMVDESQAGASGCSIDSSVHFIQNLERKYGIQLFDRLNYSYLDNNEVKSIHNSELATAIQEGRINEDTLMFDNLVKTKKDFIERWTVPFKDSWYTRMV